MLLIAAYIVAGGFPFAYLAYFKKDWNISLSGQGFASADMSAAAGYMGNAFLYLEERDANNSLVTIRTLRWVLNLLTDEGLSYTFSEASKANDDIQYVTFSGASNDEDHRTYGVEITYLASRHAGIVGGEGIQDMPVVPGSLESIVKIKNYPYKSQQNQISLVMAVATGSASVSKSGRALYSGDKAVYFSMSKHAFIGDQKVSVDVSTFASGDFEDVANSNLQLQLQGKYGADGSIKIVKVSFPPGASDIVYDPSIGAGISVEESGIVSSSLILTPFLSLALALVAFLLL
jgi:hypothetical protein